MLGPLGSIEGIQGVYEGLPVSGFRVSGFGFRVQGLGFVVFRVQGP